MVSPWPFAQWGLDLIGPMPEGKGQAKYVVVAVDYFTKYAEAEALATITAARIETFVWQNIICCFSIPNTIVTDNGQQFDNAKFKQFCSNLKIRLCFASSAHPQSNGQMEAVNKIIMKTLKTKLGKTKGCWPKLLLEIGDWVMRKVSLATKNPTEGTLGPTWEVPHEITKVCYPGTYQLCDPKGKTLPHPWNAGHLKYYYKQRLQDSEEGASVVAGPGSGSGVASVVGLGEGGSPLISKLISIEGLNLVGVSSQRSC
ncbi:unnamed protein product [Prunus brigantina]